MKKTETKFDVSFLEYGGGYFHTTESDKTTMPEDIYKEYSALTKAAQDKVLYSNARCNWDSCDCGDGYGCSHGSWVYEIKFNNHEKARIEFVDDGLCFCGDSGEELSISHQDFTIADFERFCELCGIKLLPITPTP